jgi:uncharacterized membrane-anchored protein YhcB (DUF1043 family)
MTLVIAALAVVAAFAIGLFVGRRRSRRDAERARELEDRLQLAEDEMNRYRADVSEHFGETSKLLRDLTLQYRSVYEHLAEGARTLCPEAGTLLPTSLAELALPAAASEPPGGNGAATPEPASDDAQLDLELDRAAVYESARPEHADLGPLLDEQIEALGEEQAEASTRP